MLCSATLFAQTKAPAATKKLSLKKNVPDAHAPVKIHVTAKNYNDSVVVRWVPENPALWLLAQTEGYKLKRYTMKNSGKQFIVVDSLVRVIKPWTMQEWENNFKATRDSSMLVGAQLLQDYSGGAKGKKSPTSIFDKYKEQQDRYGFALILSDMDRNIANGMGLRFVDNVKPISDNYYLYEVIALVDHGSMAVDTGKTSTSDIFKYHPDTMGAISYSPGEKSITLRWSAYSKRGTKYSAYIIERSEDGRTFFPLTKHPYIYFDNKNKAKDNNKIHGEISYTDSVKQDYRKYYYRVSGINAFADVSVASPIIEAAALDRTPPKSPEVFEHVNIPGTQMVSLKWRKRIHERDLKGYVVGRSTSFKGPFEPIVTELLSATDSSFVDRAPKLHQPNFYMVAAVDTAGNVGRSDPVYAAIKDTIPPAKPTGLTGEIDTAGNVYLHWHKGPEEDIDGYLVSFSNAPDHKFTTLSKGISKDTTFYTKISLRTLTKKIYYRVAAVDRAKNASPSSDVLALEKPDKVPPVAASITKFHVTDSAVSFSWVKSFSNDLKKQLIYRQDSLSGKYLLLATLDNTAQSYLDKTVLPGHYYVYTVESIDSSNLSSGKCFPLKVYVYVVLNAGNLNNLKAVADTANKKTLITWDRPSTEVDYYALYQNVNGGSLKFIGRIPGKIIKYEAGIKQSGSYSYALKAFYKDGRMSSLTNSNIVNCR